MHVPKLILIELVFGLTVLPPRQYERMFYGIVL